MRTPTQRLRGAGCAGSGPSRTHGQQSELMANTAASPSSSMPGSWRQGPLPYGADVYSAPGYTQGGTELAPGSARPRGDTELCLGGHSTPQMSARSRPGPSSACTRVGASPLAEPCLTWPAGDGHGLLAWSRVVPCVLGESSWGKVEFFRACWWLGAPSTGCWVAVAVPPWQGKLAVTHHPHQPCLLGDSS